MHTVCETIAFQKAAHEAGMVREEIDRLVEIIANDPQAGDIIQGTVVSSALAVAAKARVAAIAL